MYKKEDLKFFNMKKTTDIFKNTIFSIERELSIEEKIQFIDEIENGIASYLLNIIKKWDEEKDSLPKNTWGSPKTVSVKAWIKRNDERKKIDIEYKIGWYWLFGTQFKEMSLKCPTTEYSHRMIYTNDNIVNQWFHDLCYKLYSEEAAYFQTIDPVQIKISKVKEYANKYHIYFDSKKVNDIVWNDDKKITEPELNIYLDAYAKIESYINEITKEVEQKVKVLTESL